MSRRGPWTGLTHRQTGEVPDKIAHLCHILAPKSA